MKKIKRIIKAIEQKNETVIHEGVFCKALDVQDGTLLWCKSTNWLGLRKETKYFNYLSNRNDINVQNVPIYKNGKVLFLEPELKELLNQIEK